MKFPKERAINCAVNVLPNSYIRRNDGCMKGWEGVRISTNTFIKRIITINCYLFAIAINCVLRQILSGNR